MGALAGNNNASGNSGGKSLNDRKLAAEVRSLTLTKIKEVLDMPLVTMKKDDYELYKALLIRLSGTVLPRLQEHTGDSGSAIPVKHDLKDKDKNLILDMLKNQNIIPATATIEETEKPAETEETKEEEKPTETKEDDKPIESEPENK